MQQEVLQRVYALHVRGDGGRHVPVLRQDVRLLQEGPAQAAAGPPARAPGQGLRHLLRDCRARRQGRDREDGAFTRIYFC